MSWVNERGTKEITLENGVTIQGLPVGTAVIGHKLILFTTKHTQEYPNPNTGIDDYIYMLEYTNKDTATMKCTLICNKALNFSTMCPFETLVSYESEKIKKVYWTDDRNQPRVINIGVSDDTSIDRYFNSKPNTFFDFSPTLALTETVTVTKSTGVAGMFAPGVIQYALTYYNKYGQESGIFYTTPLLYISHVDRGASPEDKVQNAFTIRVKGIDTNFDYLRIYSIQRTSINGTPICKRVQDISIKNVDSLETVVSYTDTGTNGDSIDPTELLYKGGEFVQAKTLVQKDNTLFLGNLKTTKYPIANLEDNIQQGASIECNTRIINAYRVSDHYSFQLSATGARSGETPHAVPCGGFKTGNYYRLGVQFQHKSGKWSEPIHIIKNVDTVDHEQTNIPSVNDNNITLPNFKGTLTNYVVGNDTLFNKLRNAGYYKIRPVVVFPTNMDKDVICQTVATPVLKYGESNKMKYSSWFFRPYNYKGDDDTEEYDLSPTATAISPKSCRGRSLHYQSSPNPESLRLTEIEGTYGIDSTFYVDSYWGTFHSPDLEFDEQTWNAEYNHCTLKYSGTVTFDKTYSDIDIQTETPGINGDSCFDHKTIDSDGPEGIVSGLFYTDFIVDDHDNAFRQFDQQRSIARWLVFPWQGTGSLNNDCSRPADKGVQSAVLKKKIISNYRNSITSLYTYANRLSPTGSGSPNLSLFTSNEVSILKLKEEKLKVPGEYENFSYMGNVDTLLMPTASSDIYFAHEGITIVSDTDVDESWTGDNPSIDTKFNSKAWLKICPGPSVGEFTGAIGQWKNYNWTMANIGIGDTYSSLNHKKLPVRMKYKSTPHLVGTIPHISNTGLEKKLPVFDVCHATNKETRYGGYSPDALQANTWVPCGEPVVIPNNVGENYVLSFYYDYGDTYFQRWDCLKTYAFTPEDINQVIEIGSFMLETYVNIDGRYDRNREQMNNLNMSPQNYNLLNPVYSQVDNFFSYKIQPEDAALNSDYPNLLTWTLTKESGADVDQWTHITLANILEMDGDKGEVTALQRFNNSIVCFQESGLSRVLYNENTAVTTTEGVPIEIANSNKVQGKDYISGSIGCRNKWSIVNTPVGIYFMDNNDKSIYLFNGQLTNLSLSKGFNSWCKQNIIPDREWNTKDFNAHRISQYDDSEFDGGAFVSYYDRQNQDVLFINNDTALAFSEKVGMFTSFYSYSGSPYLCNLDDTVLWLRGHYDEETNANSNTTLWKHQSAEDYCSFFGETQPYSMTLVGNPEPLLDKTFTNIEFRACVTGEGVFEADPFDETFDETFHPNDAIGFYLPFDMLDVWNEYQSGGTALENKMGHDLFKHHTPDHTSSLIRKFRIWRCDIPRNNDSRDRIRNTWTYIKLSKQNGTDIKFKTEIHDVVLTYFI